MGMNCKYMVSVRLMTYNHAKFIAQAIESILMQQTNFKVEIVVGDDFSADKTLDIIRAYQNTKNIHIRILKREQGDAYWVKRKKLGRLYNFTNILDNCNGKYIALLDGDDYWIDPLKLQKQVDFLEANNDYYLVAHDVRLLFENVEEKYPFQVRWNKNIISFEDEFKHHFIPTLSVMFRKKYIQKLPKEFEKLIVGDIPLFLFILSQGQGWYIHEKMAVKRRNLGGITQNKVRKQNLLEGMYFVWVYIKKFTPISLVHEMNIRLAGYERALFKKKIASRNIFAFKYLFRSIIHDFKWYLKFLLKTK
jgi:glycosyltransferase involved in cell wall biosynthesis